MQIKFTKIVFKFNVHFENYARKILAIEETMIKEKPVEMYSCGNITKHYNTFALITHIAFLALFLYLSLTGFVH